MGARPRLSSPRGCRPWHEGILCPARQCQALPGLWVGVWGGPCSLHQALSALPGPVRCVAGQGCQQPAAWAADPAPSLAGRTERGNPGLGAPCSLPGSPSPEGQSDTLSPPPPREGRRGGQSGGLPRAEATAGPAVRPRGWLRPCSAGPPAQGHLCPHVRVPWYLVHTQSQAGAGEWAWERRAGGARAVGKSPACGCPPFPWLSRGWKDGPRTTCSLAM